MKRQRLVWRVLWVRDHWELRGVGFSRHVYKAEAIRIGRAACKAHHASGQLAQLVICGKDGRIQTEHTYGADPRRSKG